MTDDIVTQLLETMKTCDAPNCLGCEMEMRAVQEIELLRAEVDRLNTALQAVSAVVSEAVYGE